MQNVIEVKNLSKRYDFGFEIKNMNLNIKKGFITGFVGENGAGKTTFIKLILNILMKNSGEINIFAKSIDEFSDEIMQDIGIVLDDIFFPEVLTANDINIIMKDIYKKWDSNLFFKYLDKFKILRNSKIKNLSKGMKKKLELATALSHHPKLLILDEPTSGLDPVVRSEVLDIFLDFIQDEENSIFLSTHITTDLETIADDIVFINNGNIILQESKDEILVKYGILKCNFEDLEKIDSQDVLKLIKNKYGYEILISLKNKLKEKYSDFIIDDINLETLMLMMIKGVELC